MNPLLKSNFLEGEQESTMLESCLTFIASLMSIRTNIGNSLLNAILREI
jgi:hypothetical protein